MMAAYYKRLTSRNATVRAKAAQAWCTWEGATSYLRSNPNYIGKFDDADYAAAFARIEAHYFVNKGFFDTDDQLLRNAKEDQAYPLRDRAGPL